jgi:benzoate membrane transport protein
MWALGLGMGLCTLVPSLVAAQAGHGGLVHAGRGGAGHGRAGGGFSMAEAVGAFMVCAALITLAV